MPTSPLSRIVAASGAAALSAGLIVASSGVAMAAENDAPIAPIAQPTPAAAGVVSGETLAKAAPKAPAQRESSPAPVAPAAKPTVAPKKTAAATPSMFAAPATAAVQAKAEVAGDASAAPTFAPSAPSAPEGGAASADATASTVLPGTATGESAEAGLVPAPAPSAPSSSAEVAPEPDVSENGEAPADPSAGEALPGGAGASETPVEPSSPSEAPEDSVASAPASSEPGVVAPVAPSTAAPSAEAAPSTQATSGTADPIVEPGAVTQPVGAVSEAVRALAAGGDLKLSDKDLLLTERQLADLLGVSVEELRGMSEDELMDGLGESLGLGPESFKQILSLDKAELDELTGYLGHMAQIKTEKDAAKFFVGKDGLRFLDLAFGPDVTDEYVGAVNAYLESGSYDELVDWFLYYFGGSEDDAKAFARAIAAAVTQDDEVDVDHAAVVRPAPPAQAQRPQPPAARPVAPAKGADARPVRTVQPEKPFQVTATRSASDDAALLAGAGDTGRAELVNTGVDAFGPAGLGVLALMAGGLGVAFTRRPRKARRH